MYTFILTIVVVSFISLCFFKKNFWENRYMVLAIIGGVALIATLTINYATRNNEAKVVKTIWTKDSQLMNLEGSLIDSNFVAKVDSLSLTDFNAQNDTIQNHFIIYNDGDGYRIGFAYDDELESKNLDEIIIRESNSDKSYYTKERLFYGHRNNPWVVDISLPRIKTYRCYYVPHDDYVKLKSTGLIKTNIQI